jgi:hypothetical protein
MRGYPCGKAGKATCFFLADAAAFPWGIESAHNPLEPLRPWTVNNLEYGSVLYAPEGNRQDTPQVDGLGGFTHDGCFRADDMGYSLGDGHVDVFAGTQSMYNVLEGMLPSFSRLDVYAEAEHCDAL